MVSTAPVLSTPEAAALRAHVREVVAGYVCHWHRIACDTAMFGVAGSAAIAGFALTLQEPSRAVTNGVPLAILALGWAGAVFAWLIKGHTVDNRSILVRLDKADGLFEVGRYVPGEAVYPPKWERSGTAEFADPVLKYACWLQVFMPMGLAGFVWFVLQAR